MVAIVFVGERTYNLWQQGPWELPRPAKARDSSAKEQGKESLRVQFANTKDIVEKNLFDPQRGASRAQEAEVSSVAMQRIRSMVLLGTAIFGDSRYAILQGPSDPRSPPAKILPGKSGSLRLKLGDTVEGFKLSEIHEKKVVFTKGASKVEVVLDYFRKIDDTKEKAKTPVPTGPGTPPSLPRRERLPTSPGTPQS